MEVTKAWYLYISGQQALTARLRGPLKQGRLLLLLPMLYYMGINAIRLGLEQKPANNIGICM